MLETDAASECEETSAGTKTHALACYILLLGRDATDSCMMKGHAQTLLRGCFLTCGHDLIRGSR